jgi:2-iminoacetate synthase ThiH
LVVNPELMASAARSKSNPNVRTLLSPSVEAPKNFTSGTYSCNVECRYCQFVAGGVISPVRTPCRESPLTS